MSTNITNETVAAMLTRLTAESGKTIEQIATELGYQSPNPFRLMLDGTVKLPIAQIPVQAQVLGCESGRLLRVALDEYMPGVVDVIEECLEVTYLTEQERRLIDDWRGQKHTTA
ncbi:hypothetical protein [Nitrogeniibacter aestuarii]|uniref:hypothetical protein n=1 Tax=Nitrogeniibacter aestuarii TaxID=2815343 RepID=UPI001D1215C4|nr:hypothetical protein [Nitrogeniibacter aestuarii]